jgi:ABC-type multidrug transport system ATPase subunit
MIILDEPMAWLDASGRQLVRQGLEDILSHQDVAIAIISHHPDDLIGLVERLWILDDGRLIYDGAFDKTPLRILSACLADHDTSLYYALRRLESHGIAVPAHFYGGASVDEIARFLSEVIK